MYYPFLYYCVCLYVLCMHNIMYYAHLAPQRACVNKTLYLCIIIELKGTITNQIAPNQINNKSISSKAAKQGKSRRGAIQICLSICHVIQPFFFGYILTSSTGISLNITFISFIITGPDIHDCLLGALVVYAGSISENSKVLGPLCGIQRSPFSVPQILPIITSQPAAYILVYTYQYDIKVYANIRVIATKCVGVNLKSVFDIKKGVGLEHIKVSGPSRDKCHQISIMVNKVHCTVLYYTPPHSFNMSCLTLTGRHGLLPINVLILHDINSTICHQWVIFTELLGQGIRERFCDHFNLRKWAFITISSIGYLLAFYQLSIQVSEYWSTQTPLHVVGGQKLHLNLCHLLQNKIHSTSMKTSLILVLPVPKGDCENKFRRMPTLITILVQQDCRGNYNISLTVLLKQPSPNRATKYIWDSTVINKAKWIWNNITLLKFTLKHRWIQYHHIFEIVRNTYVGSECVMNISFTIDFYRVRQLLYLIYMVGGYKSLVGYFPSVTPYTTLFKKGGGYPYSHRYFVKVNVPNAISWTMAFRQCFLLNGHLVDLNEPQESDFFKYIDIFYMDSTAYPKNIPIRLFRSSVIFIGLKWMPVRVPFLTQFNHFHDIHRPSFEITYTIYNHI